MVFNDNNLKIYLKTSISKGFSKMFSPFIEKLLPSSKLIPIKFCNSKGKLKRKYHISSIQ